jgi:hypothetical protein
MYRYRFSGFLKSVMSNLLLVIDNVIHLNQSFMEHANYDIFICDFVQMKTNWKVAWTRVKADSYIPINILKQPRLQKWHFIIEWREP